MKYYCSLPSSKKAKTMLVGVPYDGTSTFRPGSRFAPNAIRDASYGIESYSPYQDRDLRDIRFFDIGDIPLSFSLKELNLQIIETFISRIIRQGKRVVSLGGEHLISLPIIKAHATKYKKLAVIQLDAHSDLIDSFRGEKLSHATVMRRTAEIIGFENLYQLGIRSMVKEDRLLPFRDTHMCLFDLKKADEYIKQLKNRPVYVSIDLDVLDPSIFCGTGTPEPGGITFKELVDFIVKLKELNVVGADVVELSPHYDQSGVSSITAAVVVREILLAIAD